MNNKQWLLTEKERKLVADYREACFSTDLIAIIDRLTTPPAPAQFVCPCCGVRGEVNKGASTVRGQSHPHSPSVEQGTDVPTEAQVEAAARKMYAVKIGAIKDVDGLNAPDDLWRQCLPIARAVLTAALIASPPAPQAEGEIERLRAALDDVIAIALGGIERPTRDALDRIDRAKSLSRPPDAGALRSAQAPTAEFRTKPLWNGPLQITLESRPDGGLRISSAEMPGLILSGSSERILQSLVAAINALVEVGARRVEPRTYADGIEDAAKAAKYVVENCGTMRFVQANGWVGLRDRVDTSIRALANKAP